MSDQTDFAGKLNRDTLASQVARHLIDHMRAANLQPGDPLPSEAKLAQNFGVSRPVIREALRMLEGRGVIDISNGKSPTIKPLTNDMLRSFFARAIDLNRRTFLELIEVRRGIEIQSAILAAGRRTPNELEAMRGTVAIMRESLHDPEVFADHDLALHLQIARATHNTMMVHLIDAIRESLRGMILAGLQHSFTEDDLQGIQKHHEDLLEALIAGDAAWAGRAMDAHFNYAVKLVGDEALED